MSALLKIRPVMLAVILILSVVALAVLAGRDSGETVKRPAASSQGKPPAGFDKKRYSINDPDSLWVVVNKGRKLAANFEPQELVTPDVPLRYATSSLEMKLRGDAAAALEELFSDARANRLELKLTSGYRSFASQQAIYSRNVKTDGQLQTDATSARAGHSEHQTGLAADVSPSDRRCELNKCFADTPQGIWLAQNSYKFGFIIRYQNLRQRITGYDYEPWHLRYVGAALATEINKKNQTLEEFFDLPASPTYPVAPLILTPGA